MAFFTGNIRSKALKMDTQFQVIVPQDGKFCPDPDKPAKLLILLHGLSDNASCWSRYTAIERYAEKHNILVAMPEVQRSFYWNMKYGLHYEDYIGQELPELLRKLFHVSENPEDVIIAGLSMGGYGALRCALKYPETFRSCASFSGVLWPMEVKFDAYQIAQSGSMEDDVKAIFGENEIIPEEFSIPTLVDELYKKDIKSFPRLFLTCGTNDFLSEQNQRFHALLEEKQIPHSFCQWEGIHEWSFWDKSVEQMLKLFLE